ncbi:MAG: GreA/GreB family elongation factor [Pseudomonadota bacterium]
MTSQAFAMPPAAPVPHLLASECGRLEMLALDHEHLNPDVSALLLAELDRAILHEADALPPATVTMHAEVEYLDERSGLRRTVQLVYPSEADVARGRISILTPVAAGLIGLTIGDRIAWPDRQGRDHMLRIMRVAPAGMEGSSCRSG